MKVSFSSGDAVVHRGSAHACDLAQGRAVVLVHIRFVSRTKGLGRIRSVQLKLFTTHLNPESGRS